MVEGQLYSLPLEIIDGGALVRAIVDDLTKRVWYEDPRAFVGFEHGPHIDELRRVMYVDPAMSRRIYDLHLSVDWNGLAYVNTHGAPSFSNCFIKSDGSIEIINRLRAEPAVPDVQSVDYGQILKSIMGYEQAWRDDFRWPGYESAPALYEAIDVCHMANKEREKLATKYWAVFHVLRSMQWADDDQRPRLISVINRTLEM